MFMAKVCSAAQMRKADSDAEKQCGIPSIVLMENAAFACVKALGDVKNKRILIFCGHGNNGGDGLAIARHLYNNKDTDVEVILVCGNNFSKDALINYNILLNIGVKIRNYEDIESILEYYLCSADIVVDAIYGTGIHGEIRGAAGNAIEMINKYSRFTLSADIPSGINADTGEVCGVCIKADVTVTFAAYKKGLLLYPGADYAGKVILDSISMPHKIMSDIPVNAVTGDLLKSLIPQRNADSHKGDYGKVLIAGGSRGMSGAVCMAAEAALISGAGLITAAVPAELNSVMENKLTEVMSIPLKDFHGEMSAEAAEQIIRKAESMDSLLFGVGAGRGGDIYDILEKIISSYTKTLIIDADGLFALAENPKILHKKKCDIILTPHNGEFAGLIGKMPDESERIDKACEFAKEYDVTVVLKGSHTVIADSEGNAYINMTGNAGMASGGSGDVLAGMTAAFAARMSAPEAAVLGAGLHGLAGDLNMLEEDIESVAARGIIRSIPKAFQFLRNNQNWIGNIKI